jgi:hypothetical protein
LTASARASSDAASTWQIAVPRFGGGGRHRDSEQRRRATSCATDTIRADRERADRRAPDARAVAAEHAPFARRRCNRQQHRRGFRQEVAADHRELRPIGLVRLAEVLRLEREHVLAPPGPPAHHVQPSQTSELLAM